MSVKSFDKMTKDFLPPASGSGHVGPGSRGVGELPAARAGPMESVMVRSGPIRIGNTPDRFTLEEPGDKEPGGGGPR